MSGPASAARTEFGWPYDGRHLLAAALVLGGGVGILGLGSSLASSGELSLGIPAVVVSVVLYAACIIVGWALWHGHSPARRLAMGLFALQLPTVSAFGVTYEFFTAAAVRVAVDLDGGLNGSVEAGAFVALTPGSVYGPGYLGVNLVAVGAVWYLWRSRRSPAAETG